MQSSGAILGAHRTGPAQQNYGDYLATRNCTDDQEWFRSIRNRIWQRRIGGFMRQIFAAREKTDHWSANLRHMITHCPAQHRIFSFNCVQQRALSQRSVELKSYFPLDVRQRTQIRRKNNANHWMNKLPSLKSQVPNKFQIPNVKMAGTESSRIWDLIIESLFGIWGPWELGFAQLSVCTSTDNTAGKSRTIGFHLSPASTEP
jgi:hypothetical protein